MNQTSPLVTGAAGATASALVPIIGWAASVWHVSIPADVQVSLAVGLVTAAHWIGLEIVAHRRATQAAPAQ